MRKTKIVCTMGPRESDDNILAELAKEMDVARFNFSHGTHETHLEMLTRVRKVLAHHLQVLHQTKEREQRNPNPKKNESIYK